jgi:hypothetical protein
MIILTMIFGTTFLVVKAFEYTAKYNDGLVPVTGLNKKTHGGVGGENYNTNAGLEPDSQMKNSLNPPDSNPRGEGMDQHANPRGEFQWHDTSLAVKAQQEGFLTESERLGYMENGEIVAEKFRDRVRMFFWIYFTMTGLHALHMIIGLGIMAWLLWKAWMGAFTPEYYAPVEMSGLYWHFVDIVWIFLFPLLYLLGRHFIAGGGGGH